jgi:hypothetical protein
MPISILILLLIAIIAGIVYFNVSNKNEEPIEEHEKIW